MLPWDSRDIKTQVKIWGFENALENALACNPTALNEFWKIDKAYRALKLDLVDALERSCVILMNDPCLLEAFCDIPRQGYAFMTIVDININMWLLINTAHGKIIRRRLGTGLESQSRGYLVVPSYDSDATESTFENILKERLAASEMDADSQTHPLAVDREPIRGKS